MGIRPCVITEDITITWDGQPQRLVRGQLIDVPADSALERAIGLDHLATLSGVPLAAPAEAAEQEPQAPADAKKRNGKSDGTGTAETPAAATATPEGDH